jgi:hypothetical protein
VLLAGCSIFVKTSDLDDGTPVPDAGKDATVEAAVVSDAGIADADACISHASTRNPPPIVPLAPEWNLTGNAAAADGGLQLMEAAKGQSGTAYWREAIASFEAFDMTAGLFIDPYGSVPGDGVAFAWIAGDDIPPVGGPGGDMAVGGIGLGWATTVDFLNYQDSDPVDGPFIGLADTRKDEPGIYTTAVRIKGNVYGAEHFLHVTLLKGGIVSAWWDDELVLDHVQIPAYAPYKGHWGFTAASGGNYALVRLTRVSFVDRTNDTCPYDD